MRRSKLFWIMVIGMLLGLYLSDLTLYAIAIIKLKESGEISLVDGSVNVRSMNYNNIKPIEYTGEFSNNKVCE